METVGLDISFEMFSGEGEQRGGTEEGQGCKTRDVKAVLSDMAATSRLWLFKLELKIQVLGRTSHISSAPEPHVAGGSGTGPRRYRMFPSVWKVLLDSTELKHVCALMGKTLEREEGERTRNVP